MTKIDIRRQCYNMVSKDGESAEITLYGDVVETRPINFWTGEEMKGNFIMQDEFVKDLEMLKKCKAVTIRISSYGGDAVVGMLIHNRLRDMARAGIKLTCVVDAVAMSAASVIMSACDTVKVNATGLVMIHRASAFLFGYYDLDDLEETAGEMKKYDEALSAAYTRKTGIDQQTILQMMADTTYLTGREAVEKGFADELLEDAKPLKLAANARGTALIVNGQMRQLPGGITAPDFIPTAAPEEEAAASSTVNPTEAAAPAVETIIISPDDSGNEGGNPMTLEELRASQPELVQQIEASAAQTAVQKERARLQGIDEVAALMPAELVAEAKYGATACSAETLALRAAKAAAKAGNSFLSNLEEDSAKSGTADVTAAAPAPVEDGADKPGDLYAAGKQAGQAYHTKKEGK